MPLCCLRDCLFLGGPFLKCSKQGGGGGSKEEEDEDVDEEAKIEGQEVYPFNDELQYHQHRQALTSTTRSRSSRTSQPHHGLHPPTLSSLSSSSSSSSSSSRPAANVSGWETLFNTLTTTQPPSQPQSQPRSRPPRHPSLSSSSRPSSRSSSPFPGPSPSPPPSSSFLGLSIDPHCQQHQYRLYPSGGSGLASTPRHGSAEARACPYMCPVCFHYFPSILVASSCCSHYVCYGCLLGYVASRYEVSPSDLPYLDVPFLLPIPCPLCASPSFAPAPVSRFAPVRSYEDEGREGGLEGGTEGGMDGEMSVSVVGGEERMDGEDCKGGKDTGKESEKEEGKEVGEKQWQQEREHDEKLNPGHSAAML